MKINQFYLFSKLSGDSLDKLESKVSKKKYSANSIIFYNGEKSDELHMLVSGIVKIYKYNFHNEEIVLNYFNSPSLVAEMPTLEKIPFPASCSAESDVEMWILKRDDFINLLEENPSISLEIISSMSRKIKALEHSIDQNISKSATQRVISTILDTPEMFEKLSRVKIASVLNIQPETLSRTMKKLKDSKLIEIEGKKVQSLDRDGLMRFMN